MSLQDDCKMFCCVRRVSPWAKEAVGLPARGCLFRDSVYSVCSVDFLVAYGKILKDPCRPCDIFRVLLAERTAYESSSVCTHINAAVFLHVSANVEDKTILVVVIVDAHPVVARVVRTEETIDAIYYTYYI